MNDDINVEIKSNTKDALRFQARKQSNNPMTLYVIGKEFDDFHTTERIKNLRKGLYNDQNFLIMLTPFTRVISYCGISVLKELYKIPEEQILDGNDLSSHLSSLGNLKRYKLINLVGLEITDAQKDLVNFLCDNVEKSDSTNWKIYIRNEDIRDRLKDVLQASGFNNIQSFSIDNMISIQNSDKEKERFERNKAFNEFFGSAQGLFNKFLENDERAKFYQDRYMLCVCPGSRWGMDNSSVIEVFWGNRNIENEQVSKKGFKMISESGSTLYIIKKLSGKVDIFLFPCMASNEDPKEKAGVVYKTNVEPVQLRKNSFLKKLWKAFMTYTENTSIDGEPSLAQKVKYYYYTYCKKHIKNGNWQTRKILKYFYWFINFVVSVGLSGFIITMVNRCDENGLTQDDVKDINQNLVNENNQLENTTKVLKEIKIDIRDIKSNRVPTPDKKDHNDSHEK